LDYSSGTRVETGKPLPTTAVRLNRAHWITVALFFSVLASVGAMRMDVNTTAPGVIWRAYGFSRVTRPREIAVGSNLSAIPVARPTGSFEVVAHFSATYAPQRRRQMPVVLTIPADSKKRDTTCIGETSAPVEDSPSDASDDSRGTIVVVAPLAEHGIPGDSASQLSYHEGMRVQVSLRIASERTTATKVTVQSAKSLSLLAGDRWADR
jgi:hypothetical protein